MLRAWTRRGQIEMISELKQLVRQAETLASQERALERAGGGAAGIQSLLDGSQATLRKLEADLTSGARPRETRRELTAFYRIVVRETARADAARHGHAR